MNISVSTLLCALYYAFFCCRHSVDLINYITNRMFIIRWCSFLIEHQNQKKKKTEMKIIARNEYHYPNAECRLIITIDETEFSLISKSRDFFQKGFIHYFMLEMCIVFTASNKKKIATIDVCKYYIHLKPDIAQL